MISNAPIAILLATYNGGKYLNEQLSSLLGQTFGNFHVYVRDDGSSDNTLAIIDEVTRTDERITLLRDGHPGGRGAAGSFMWLLNEVEAEYYMFCDQDDFWLPDKIEKTFDRMVRAEAADGEIPLLIHTDLVVADEDLTPRYPSYWEFSRFRPAFQQKFNYLCVCNCVTGCTTMINRKARDLSIDGYRAGLGMHDYWIAANVARHGKIHHIPVPTILYRQHHRNTVGARNIDNRYFLNKITGLAATLRGQKEFKELRDALNYGCNVKYYFYKILFTIRRNL